jgi:hypothetical protein
METEALATLTFKGEIKDEKFTMRILYTGD